MTTADPLATQTRFFELPPQRLPFRLFRGGRLEQVTLAYETYGRLAADGANAVLVFHALTGSQHVAGWTEAVPGIDLWTAECRRGWWDAFVGPGKAIDTDRHFVIAANYLGGCYGSTGPASIDPATGRPYGASFPEIRCVDIVESQIALLDHLGIDTLHAAIGGSVGGMLSVLLALRHPHRVRNVVPIASGIRTSPLQFLHNFEQTVAILNDPAFRGGDYYDGPKPDQGLALARMIGHKTFVSLDAMSERAGGRVEPIGQPDGYPISHPLESYIWNQGRRFVERFDANSYLRLMWLWQHFDLAAEAGAENDDLVEWFRRMRGQRHLVFSIDSDVCFYPEEQAHLARILRAAGVDATHATVHSEKGHDSFLLEPQLYEPHLAALLDGPLTS